MEIIMKMGLRIVFLGIMTLVLIAASANAVVIVAENFGGGGSGGLNGTAADTFNPVITAAGGSATWVANSGFLDNGLVSNISRRAAYLNMGSYINNAKGTAKGLFTLTMTISETSGTSWLSLGFGQENTPSTDKDFTNASSVGATGTTNGLGTIIYRSQTSSPAGELDMFGGPGSANVIDGPDGNTGPRTLTVALDLTPAGGTHGKVTWSDSALGVINSYTYTAARTFNSILITGSTTCTISNLTLSQTGQSSPSHSPDPASYETGVEVDLSSQIVPEAVSWMSPDNPDDPDIVQVFGYNLYMDTDQTKVLNATPASADLLHKSLQSGGQTDTNFDPPTNLAYETTYYWRVDALVDLDSVPGTTIAEATTLIGSVWSFTTVPEYLLPDLTVYSVVTTVDLLPAEMSATVTGNSDPITSVVFTLLTDDSEFPPGATAVLIDTTGDNQNPTATLEPNMPGTYKVKLEISDGTTTVEEIAAVFVYEDSCEAQKNTPSGWTKDRFDSNDDCIVNLVDFADMALEWLHETSMTSQETYKGDVVYEPVP
jgi:hypothetical protein